jgi:hypothetical protein
MKSLLRYFRTFINVLQENLFLVSIVTMTLSFKISESLKAAGGIVYWAFGASWALCWPVKLRTIAFDLHVVIFGPDIYVVIYCLTLYALGPQVPHPL